MTQPGISIAKYKPVANANAGFTLVELVVAITVSVIVVGFMAMFIATPLQAYLAQSRRAELVSEADLAMRNIENDLQSATVGSVSATNNGNSATLKIGAGAGAVTYICDANAHVLQRRFGASNALIAQDINGCEIDYLNAPLHDRLVSIQLRFSRVIQGQANENLTIFQQARIG